MVGIIQTSRRLQGPSLFLTTDLSMVRMLLWLMSSVVRALQTGTTAVMGQSDASPSASHWENSSASGTRMDCRRDQSAADHMSHRPALPPESPRDAAYHHGVRAVVEAQSGQVWPHTGQTPDLPRAALVDLERRRRPCDSAHKPQFPFSIFPFLRR